MRERKAGSMVERLTDGRSITISYRPMPTGGFVVTFEDITERLLAEERIKHLAHYDALTDLPNRVTFYERMESVLSHLRRSETIAVLSLDLDHFKASTIRSGIPSATCCCKAAAERMRGCVRSEDLVARLGGDEFAIVQVPSEQPPDIAALATRLIEVDRGALRSRWPSGDRGRQRRYRHRAERQQQAGRAHEERRSGALSRQGRWRRRLPLFRSRNGRPHAGAPRARTRSAQGDREWRIRALLSAHHRRQKRTSHQLRSAHPLASSRTRHGCAARIHPGRGRNRADRAVGRMGAAAGLQRSCALAEGRDRSP